MHKTVLEKTHFPPWLKKTLTYSEQSDRTKNILTDFGLQSVCERAKCPNIGECFSKGRATFLILGGICTRDCKFCAIRSGKPFALDQDEPKRVAQAAEGLELQHVVVTSVTRDDLPDYGANQFAKTVIAVRGRLPHATIEVLVPDFGAKDGFIEIVIEAGPDIFNHNLDTVPRLYKEIRPKANYWRSLCSLELAKKENDKIYTKSGLMVGMGEHEFEVYHVMEDLRRVDCDCLTIGQYLRPSSQNFPIYQFIHPDQFKAYEAKAYEMGFKNVSSGPFVRSSYQAEKFFAKISPAMGR